MDRPAEKFIEFERRGFSGRLPEGRLYSRTHFWLAEAEPGVWRVGLTEFAARTLGEIVEFALETAPGSGVAVGQTIGWIEGFKAVSDLLCVGAGEFVGGNTEALADAGLVGADPQGRGWLYAFSGTPDPGAVNAAAYAEILGLELDRMGAKDLTRCEERERGE